MTPEQEARYAFSNNDPHSLSTPEAREIYDQLKAELDHMTEANRLLQAENDQLKTMHGLPNCYLENRWSNCAVRMRKQRELDNNGNHVNGNHR